ncbi:MAG TPA: hypothetical protein VE397_17980 [Stellaceae bacterium]|jgi:type IV pilus biogenesis protein CpaD/CtpE|nr:hypothetical protein [Stellaceae bacterium]
MRRSVLVLVALAALLAGCGSPPPTNGAMQPVDPQTGAPAGGAALTQ